MRKNWRSKDWKIEDWKIVGWRRKFVGGSIFGFQILMVIVLVGLIRCSKGERSMEADTYTCPMHPTVVSDRQGTCPVCGMDLVRKARPGEEVEITQDLASLIKSPNESVISSIKIIKGEFKTMPVSVEAQGVVTYDPRNIYSIPSRVGGRLEKVYFKYTFQPVRKGQKVADIYSPELMTAQRELLYLLENDRDNTDLIESAKSKLFLMGASQNQVADIVKRKDVTSTFSIYSPYDGYIIRDDQQAPSFTTTSASSPSSAMGGGMEGSSGGTTAAPASTSTRTLTDEFIREGSYVTSGQTLFKIVNASALRVELDLQLAQAGRVNVNDEVDLDLGNNKIVKGKIDFVQPFFTEGQEFVKIRVYVKNSGELQIGQLVRAMIRLKSLEALWIPREAVLDLGLDKIVFVKEREVFKPKIVKVGVQANKWVEITQGLSSSDQIASNAQYLMDSESFIKVK